MLLTMAAFGDLGLNLGCLSLSSACGHGEFRGEFPRFPRESAGCGKFDPSPLQFLFYFINTWVVEVSLMKP